MSCPAACSVRPSAGGWAAPDCATVGCCVHASLCLPHYPVARCLSHIPATYFIFSIWCRRLVSDLHTMLASHLEDTFCCFLDDGTHQLAASDASTQVPARLLSAACLPARPPARLPACLLAHPRACLLCLLCCGGPLDSCIAGWPAYRHFACLLIMGCPLLHAPCRLARSAWSRSCGGTWMAGRPRWRCACCRCWPRSWRQLATGGGCPGLSWPPHACARAGACPGGSLQAACQGSIST